MAQISWNKIKQDAIREFCTKYTRSDAFMNENVGNLHLGVLTEWLNGRMIYPKTIIREIEDKAVIAIEQTDVRSFKDLLKVCPDSFPGWIKSDNYLIEYTDNGFIFIKK